MNWKLILGGGLAMYVAQFVVSFATGPIIHTGILEPAYIATESFWLRGAKYGLTVWLIQAVTMAGWSGVFNLPYKIMGMVGRGGPGVHGYRRHCSGHRCQ